MSKLERKNASDRLDFDLADCEVKFVDGGTEGRVSGYGSVFNLIDRGGDIVLPGAFKASLADWRRKKQGIPMLWQHDSREVIGMWDSFAEDEKGLKLEGDLILDIPQAKIARVLLQKKAVKGLSIGYRTQDYEVDRTTGARKLKKVELWETSIVTFPMMPEANVTSVKNFDPRELEDSLREAGLSRSDAVKAIAVLRQQLQRDAGETGQAQRDAAKDLLMTIRKSAEMLRG